MDFSLTKKKKKKKKDFEEELEGVKEKERVADENENGRALSKTIFYGTPHLGKGCKLSWG